MNIATTRGAAKSSLSLPNILTYARIAAIPVVIGCIFMQSKDGPLWLRWVAVSIFIAAGVTDYLDGNLTGDAKANVEAKIKSGKAEDKAWKQTHDEMVEAREVHRARIPAQRAFETQIEINIEVTQRQLAQRAINRLAIATADKI